MIANFLLIAVIILIGGLLNIINNRMFQIGSALERQELNLDKIAERLDRLLGLIEMAEHNTLSTSDKLDRQYDKAFPITIADVRNWREGGAFKLITCIYEFPSDEPEIETFEFQYHSAEQLNDGSGSLKVNGARRYIGVSEMQKYSFVADAQGGKTSCSGGEVRLLKM